MTINDSQFQQTVSLAEAYRIMEVFVAKYHELGDTSVVEFLTYLSLNSNGSSSDPAAIFDFIAAANQVLVAKSSA